MSESYTREPAKRVLPVEIINSDYHFKEDDSEDAPQYLLLPSGGRANRIAMCGTITSVEDVSNEGSDPYWMGEVTAGGTEVSVFAGRYQPEAASTLQSIALSEEMPPAYVNLVGKTNEYRPEEDESEVIVNVQANHLSVVDEEDRNAMLVETVEQTLDRLESNEGEYTRMAQDRYDNPVEYLQEDIMDILDSI